MESSEGLSNDAVPVSDTDSGLIPEKFSEMSSKLEIAEYANEMENKKFEPFKKDIYESDEELKKRIVHYKCYMDYELLFGYKDAMILYHDKDAEDVKRLRDSIEKNMVLNDKQKPRICLHSLMATSLGGKFKALAFGIKRCTFVMLYVTANFVNDQWSEYSSEACLMEAIYNPAKRWCVVPVFSDDKSSTPYDIPFIINPLKGVRYSTEEEGPFLASITTLFNDRISVRRNNENQHLQQQIKWIREFEDKAREEALKKKKFKKL